MNTEITTPADRAAEALRLAEAATPGPWQWAWDEYTYPPLGDTYGVATSDRYPKPVARTHRFQQGYEDALLIAAARSLLPALAADVQALTAEVERLSEEVMGYQCGEEYERGYEHASLVAIKFRDERDTATAVANRLLDGWKPEPRAHTWRKTSTLVYPMTDAERAYILHHREGRP